MPGSGAGGSRRARTESGRWPRLTCRASAPPRCSPGCEVPAGRAAASAVGAGEHQPAGVLPAPPRGLQVMLTALVPQALLRQPRAGGATQITPAGWSRIPQKTASAAVKIAKKRPRTLRQHGRRTGRPAQPRPPRPPSSQVEATPDQQTDRSQQSSHSVHLRLEQQPFSLRRELGQQEVDNRARSAEVIAEADRQLNAHQRGQPRAERERGQ